MLPHESTANYRRRLLPAAAFALMIAGSALLGHALWQTLRLERAQHRDLGELASLDLTTTPATGALGALGQPQRPPPIPGELLGRLTIPARDVSASIREGVGDEVLDVASGHLPGTALPGERGNAAIAAHRDTLFSGLRSATEGDLVHVDTPAGRTTYRITALSIVEPRDLSILNPTDVPTLTLITCYPFTFVGPAPRRFIAHATLVERSSATPG